MRIDAYPPQEPLSPLGRGYHDRVMARGAGVDGHEFAYGDDPYRALTVFPAAAPSGDVLVFFHGGGWTSGWKEWMHFMAPALNAEGVTFVSAGYRLAPQHVFPTGADDAADAVAWVHAHIAEHGGDPARLFVGGHSAGAHYASLLAVTSAWRRARGLPPDVVRGALPVSGTYRFGADSGLSMRPRFLGPEGPNDAADAASPLRRIEADASAPHLVTHGSRDFAHLVVQASQMIEALGAVGVRTDLHILEGADHFEASLAAGDVASGWPARAAAWMRSIGADTSTTRGGQP